MWLESERLYLEHFKTNQGHLFEELDRNDNVVKYTGKTKMTAKQGNDFIETMKNSMYHEGLGFFACYQKSDDSFIGWFHLRKEMNLDTDVLEIGYRLKEEYWNKGYATEMSQKLLEYGFEITNLISAITLNENTASQKVMMKLNMHYDKNVDYHGFDVMRFIIHRGDHLYQKMKVTQEELDFCKNIEPIFGELTLAEVTKRYIPDRFVALIELVVFQQISLKAGRTIWRRICRNIWPLTAENILDTTDDDIQNCGLSYRKVAYIKNIARYYIEHQDVFNKIEEMEDTEIIKFLTAIKGIGPWTANIFLMLSLNKLNYTTYLDLALKNMVESIIDEKNITESTYNNYLERFSPYKTIASLCLWAQIKRTN